MSFRIQIDRELCLESGQCAYLQPAVFELDGDGQPQVIATVFGDTERQAADDAAEMCPSQAISVEEDR